MRAAPLRAALAALGLAMSCAAQMPSHDVTDLLANDWRSGQDGGGFVERVMERAQLPEDGQWRHGLRTYAAWQLLPGWPAAHEIRTDAEWWGGWIDREALVAVLEELTESAAADFRIERIGRRYLLRGGLPEQTSGALERVRRALPGPVEIGVRLERLRSGGSEILVEGETRLVTGARRTFGTTVRRPMVVDMDCEIAGAAWIHVPRRSSQVTGAMVGLRARAVPFTDLVVVEVVARDGEALGGGSIPFQSEAGPLERVDQRTGEVATALVAGRGQRVAHTWESMDGTRHRLTLEVGGPRGEAEGQGVLIGNSNLISEGVLGFRSDRPGRTELGSDPAPTLWGWFDRAQRENPGLFREAPPGGDLSSNDCVLIEDSPAGRRLRDRLGGQLRDHIVARSVVVEVFDVPVDHVPGVAPAESSRRLASFQGALLEGYSATFSAVRERSFLGDVDAEIAGGGARVLDPKVDVFETGWVANVTPLRSVGDRPERIELDLAITDLAELRAREVTVGGEFVQMSGARLVPPAKLPVEVARIESPHVRRFRIDSTFELDADGRHESVYRASTLLPEDRRLLLRARLVKPGASADSNG